MFGRRKVLIRGYTELDAFERQSAKLARHGYTIAEINGEPAGLRFDARADRYLVEDPFGELARTLRARPLNLTVVYTPAGAQAGTRH